MKWQHNQSKFNVKHAFLAIKRLYTHGPASPQELEASSRGTASHGQASEGV